MIKPKPETEVSLGTLYEMNKDLVEKKEPVLSKEKIEEKKTILIDYLKNINGKYYMLLCKEKSDYTVFHMNNFNENSYNMCVNIFINTLLNRGKIKGIDLTENKDAIEVWISIDNESYCYYFFDYTFGVAEVL